LCTGVLSSGRSPSTPRARAKRPRPSSPPRARGQVAGGGGRGAGLGRRTLRVQSETSLTGAPGARAGLGGQCLGQRGRHSSLRGTTSASAEPRGQRAEWASDRSPTPHGHAVRACHVFGVHILDAGSVGASSNTRPWPPFVLPLRVGGLLREQGRGRLAHQRSHPLPSSGARAGERQRHIAPSSSPPTSTAASSRHARGNEQLARAPPLQPVRRAWKSWRERRCTWPPTYRTSFVNVQCSP